MDRGLGMTECASSQGVKPRLRVSVGRGRLAARSGEWRVKGPGHCFRRPPQPQAHAGHGDKDSKHSCF